MMTVLFHRRVRTRRAFITMQLPNADVQEEADLGLVVLLLRRIATKSTDVEEMDVGVVVDETSEDTSGGVNDRWHCIYSHCFGCSCRNRLSLVFKMYYYCTM